MRRILLMAVAALGLPDSDARAATVTYSFTGNSAADAQATDFIASDVTFVPSNFGVSGGVTGGEFEARVSTAGLERGNTGYFSVTFTPGASSALTLHSVGFQISTLGITGDPVAFAVDRISSSSPGQLTQFASGGLSTATSIVNTTNGLPVTGLPGESIEIRIYAFGGGADLSRPGNNVVIDNASFTLTATAPGDVSAVPEPAGMSLLGLGAAGLLGYRLRRRKAEAVA